MTNYRVKYSKEDKDKQLIRIANQKVKQYIKDGSKGNLDLSDAPITELPAGLEVGGDLYLSDTPIAELPAGLKVGGNLSLFNNTHITQLPADLKVDGNLHLKNTPITKKYTIEQLKQMLPGVRRDIKFNI